MSKDFDEINPDDIESEPESTLLKWMSVLILLLAVGGFFALAWYAYNTGTNQDEIVQSQENLELVKADAEPIKEAPEDPGGQQFPHQDKTVFNAISGNEKNVAERILPASEEPVERDTKPETETWINNDLNKSQPVGTAQNEANQEEVKAQENAVIKDPVPDVPTVPFDPSSVRAGNEDTQTPQIPITTAISSAPDVIITKEAKVAEEPATPSLKMQAVAADVKSNTKKEVGLSATKMVSELKEPKTVSGKRVQLGAFKSQEEAEKNWNVIRAKYSSKLEGKEHRVIRVDLGAKGIFYRLHVLPFASAANAQSFCGSIAPQGCFVAGK
jgi:hypothetical protein